MKKIEELSKEEAQRALELHRNAFIFDGVSLFYNLQEGYFQRMLKAGVNATNITVAGKNTPFWEALKRMDFMISTIERNPNMMLARCSKDLDEAKKGDRVALIAGFQGSCAFNYALNYPSGESDLGLLRTFYRLGLRVSQLVNNNKNPLGDGCAERTDSGLSNVGVEVVKEMNRLGMVIDLSHTGMATSMDIIEFSRTPVVFSHSNARSLCDNVRNATDEVIQAMAEKDGVIGVVAYPTFVKWEHPTIEDLLDHIDYLVKLIGIDHVGIGTDFIEGYSDEYIVKTFTGSRPDVWGTPEQYSGYPERIDSITKLPNITKGLVARGYSDQEIMKILGENFLGVFKMCLK